MFDLPFFTKGSIALNQVRLEHLASLPLNLCGCTVLEPGCGVGLLTGFFESRCCTVYSSDSQIENVLLNREIHPWRNEITVQVHDALEPFEIPSFGVDVVFCYGLMYHVPDPKRLIANLAPLANCYFLLETHIADNGTMDENLITQWPGRDQGLTNQGCAPYEGWIYDELKRHFPYVAVPDPQPEYEGYLKVCRKVFVASHESITL